MPLILAIEPNAKQAQQLTALVRQYLRAELVIGASAQAALAAVGGRTPDLILTPALLGLRDEAALTEHLRELGTAASHVQTLAVPILASGGTRAGGGGLLGLKRERGQAETVGCEPALFAEQIGIYLERAAAERAAHAPSAAAGAASQPSDTFEFAPPDPADEAVADPIAADAAMEAVETDPLLGAWPLPAPAASSDPAPHTVVATAPEVTHHDEPTPVRTAPPASVPHAPKTPAREVRSLEMELGLASAPADAPPLWRVAEDIEDFYGEATSFSPAADEPPATRFDEQPAPAVTAAPEPESTAPEPVADDEFIELQLDDALAAVAEPEPSLDAAAEAAPEPIAPPYEPVPEPITLAPADDESGHAQERDVAAGSDSGADDSHVVAEPVVASVDTAAVRQTGPAPRGKTARPRKPAPPLDDWAYFDPSQSPFRALVRRLDEIAGQAGAGR